MGSQVSCGAAKCTDCSRTQLSHESAEPSSKLGYDPAGAVFAETLAQLNKLDQQMLRFAGSSNVVGVRWMFVIGAHREACDSNGTTALHAACRSGSLQIVQDLVRRGLSLHCVDVHGWTPLHVAIFMGRRNVTLYLLQAGAQLQRRDLQGQTPEDLCNEPWTKEVIRSFIDRSAVMKDAGPRLRKSIHEQNENSSEQVQYEPFFVPRQPVYKDTSRHAQVSKLGIAFFNCCPGKGLAFLVAAGLVRDYPIDLGGFLMRNRVDAAQLGSFLGEDYSLASTLRLEFMGFHRFEGTGIVSALTEVFKLIKLPGDLQKVDRLAYGLARIWWRQHNKADGRKFFNKNGNEVQGEALRQNLVTVDALHQLMFSAIMLHWNLHTAPGSSERVTMTEWVEMNAGVEGDGTDIPLHVQRGIFKKMQQEFIPSLQLPLKPVEMETEENNEKQVMVCPFQNNGVLVDGWARLPRQGVCRSRVIPDAGPQDLAQVMSETPKGNALEGLIAQDQLSRPKNVADSSVETVWLVICQRLLFFCAAPHQVPYAFMPLNNVEVVNSDRLRYRFVLMSSMKHELDFDQDGMESKDSKDKEGEDGKDVKNGKHGKEGKDSKGAMEPEWDDLNIIFLLPDGRFQNFKLPHLEVQMQSLEDLEMWTSKANEISRDQTEMRLQAVSAWLRRPHPPDSESSTIKITHT